MYRLYLIVFANIFISTFLFSQSVVESNPLFPTANNKVTITFYADRGSEGLKDFHGSIYAHTGVITNKSASTSDWKYVKAEWTENTDECLLTKITENQYQLTISPNIKAFYGVPETEIIEKLAFVFRSADGSSEGKDIGGKDIFIDVATNNLQVKITSHNQRWLIVEPNDTVKFTLAASNNDSLWLYQNNQLLQTTNTNEINADIVFADTGSFYLVAKASKETVLAYDSMYVLVKSAVTDSTLPNNLGYGFNETSETGGILVLFAPYKKNIYVLGDFNNWLPSNKYQMLSDGDKWWLPLKNLKSDKEYAYQYLIDGELVVADAYTKKILDPWSDQYIPESVYPNLKPYPEDKTDGIASVLQVATDSYNWQVENFKPVDGEDLVIYELLVRDFVKSHWIKHVEDSLNYLQKLGVNAIELMPFNEFEGNNSWGYNPSFYFAPDKYYGTPEIYKSFIDACHERGIAVIMDVVFNHAYGQCPLVQMYMGENGQPHPLSPWFNTTSPNPVYSWGYDFDHESEHTVQFVHDVLKYWMEEYKIDGFRFDFTKGMTNTPGDGWAYDPARIEILKKYYNYAKWINPNAIIIFEHLADNREETELANHGIYLWGNMNYAFNEASMGYVQNSDFAWASYQNRGWNNPQLIAYMESHDEERTMFKNLMYGDSLEGYNIQDTATALKRNALATVFYFSIPGPKMIWQFGELGYDYSINYNGRVGEKPVKWEYLSNPNRKALYQVYATMAKLKTSIPAFSTTTFELNVGNNISIKQITLKHAQGDVLVLGNFGLSEKSTAIEFTEKGWWYNLLTHDSIYVPQQWQTIDFKPGEYMLFSNKKYGFDNIDSTQLSVDISIFPNPARQWLFVSNAKRLEEYEIFDLTGKLVQKGQSELSHAAIYIAGLTKGMHIIRFKQNGNYKHIKFLKL